MSKSVLVVDDNQEIVKATCLRLRAAGYETMTAFNGEDGISSANENQPDAILLDVRMPGKDGLTALDELKKSEVTRDIPVVMLSASVVDQNAALESGARYFLRKPHDGSQLIDALRAVAPN